MGGINLGRIHGIPVELRHSFLFLLLLAFYGGILHGLGARAVWVLLIGCASVFAHELGHAAVARIIGLPVVSISLHALGGSVLLAGIPRRPRDEILVASAGCMVSLLLAGAGGLWLLATNALWAEVVIAVNLLLAGGNLLPALPLDGGRIFRAALVPAFGLRRATRIALIASRVIAACLAVGGLLAGTPILLPLAGMLWISSASDARVTERWAFSEVPTSYPGRIDVLAPDGKPAGRRAVKLGSTYVIEQHQAADGPRWVVRAFDGRVLLVTDTPLGAGLPPAAHPPATTGAPEPPVEEPDGCEGAVLAIC